MKFLCFSSLNFNLYAKHKSIYIYQDQPPDQLGFRGKDCRIIRYGDFNSVNLEIIEQLYRGWKAINAWNALCNASYLPLTACEKN